MKILMKAFLFTLFIFLITVHLSARTLLLDDFNSGGANNKFDGANAPYRTCTGVYTYNPSYTFGKSGYSLKINYDVSTTFDYCGYAFRLNGKDLSQYNYISFWVRGASGGEFFKVELKNRDQAWLYNRASGKSYILDYLDNGVTTSWQKVTIPLATFCGLDQWTNMFEFNFTFENTQSLLNGSPTTGTIYVDNIVFGTWDSGHVRVDHYGDKVGISGLGGNMGDMPSTNTNASHWERRIFTNTDYTPYNQIIFPQSLLTSYHIETNWAGCYTKIGGGTNGEVKVESDFSKYDFLTLFAKAKSSSENPKTMKIELKHELFEGLDPNDPWSAYWIINIKSTWSNYRLDLSNPSVGTVHKTNINIFTYIFERWRIKLLNGATNDGAVLIDNVQFEKAGWTPDATVPTTPTLFKCGGEALTNGFVFGLTNTLFVGADSDSADLSLEGVFFEYSLDNGVTWNLIGTDYDTADAQYMMKWNTSGIADKSSIQLRAYALDATGNKSGFLTFNGKVVNVTNPEANVFKKPDQKILTPNNDGANDTLNFTGLVSGYEINIFNVKGQLVRKITDVTYWDGKDKNGKVCENGIYIYQVNNNGQKIEGTILIVK